MSALTAASVAYTPSGRSYAAGIEDNGTRMKKLKIVFGDATSTYPSGGIPLSNLKNWGFPYEVSEVILTDASNGDGYVYKWDSVNNKLRIYQSPAVTATGTVAAPTFTGNAIQPTFTVSNGTIGSNMTVGLTANAVTASFVGGTGITSSLSLTTNNPVGTVTATGTNSAPAFTGTAVAATALAEVATSFAPASNVTLYAYVRGH